MAVKKDYYKVLGVSRDATKEDIKKAFRKLAFECHPDRNYEQGAEERFKEINEAYQILGDNNKRAEYDRWDFNVRGFVGFDDFVSGLGDVFDAFFAGTTRVRSRVPQQGGPLHYKLTLSFEDAVFGCDKEVEITRTEYCSRCRGQGGEPGSQLVRCPECNGAGEVRRVQNSLFGRFVNRVVCDRCYGEGSILTEPCQKCKGMGRERTKRKIIITVPAGVDNGSRIRLRGEGEAGSWGGPAGDLYVTVSVQEHAFFKRDKNNLLYDLPVNFAQAALGDEVDVPSMNGRVTVKIPAGTQTGRVIEIKGKGINNPETSERGDLLITVRVVTPDKLDDEQKRLFAELARSLGKVKLAEGGNKSFFDWMRRGTKD